MNQKMTDDSWWETVREKVETNEPDSVEDMWEGISAAVAASGRRRRIGKAAVFATLLSAAAALAVVLALPHRAIDGQPATLAQAQEQVCEPAATSAPAPAQLAEVPAALENSPCPSEAALTPEQPILPNALEEKVAVEANADKATETPEKPATAVYQNIDQYLASIDDEPARRRGRLHISLSSNEEAMRQNYTSLITEWDSVSYIQDDEVETPLTTSVVDVRSTGNAVAPGVSEWSEAQRSERFATKTRTVTSTYCHFPPITLKLAASYDLSERLSAETGIAYTLLNSEKVDFSSNTVVQRLRFVGLPLGLRYSIVKNGRSSLYCIGGGQVDKCVKADLGNGNMSVKPLFWSASASLGYQYSILPDLSLFLEAGGSYHFDNGFNEVTIYTEHPLLSSIQVGLRF